MYHYASCDLYLKNLKQTDSGIARSSADDGMEKLYRRTVLRELNGAQSAVVAPTKQRHNRLHFSEAAVLVMDKHGFLR